MAINIRVRDLVYPYFVVAGRRRCERIPELPGISRFSVDTLLRDAERTVRLGIPAVLLFGVAEQRDGRGAAALAEAGPVPEAVRALKREFPQLTVMTDICLCAYTDHGHCGILKGQRTAGRGGLIDGVATRRQLAAMAVLHARAGADWVAPSAMAPRQVAAIRAALDAHGLRQTWVLGYSAKFASNFYGPFRAAAKSAPAFGDRRSYQLAPANAAAALREVADDVREGAAMVMVKPALAYLDIIRRARELTKVPLAAYNVSGEYAMVKLGARHGLWREEDMVREILTAIKRAGADTIITYHARDYAARERA